MRPIGCQRVSVHLTKQKQELMLCYNMGEKKKDYSINIFLNNNNDTFKRAYRACQSALSKSFPSFVLQACAHYYNDNGMWVQLFLWAKCLSEAAVSSFVLNLFPFCFTI